MKNVQNKIISANTLQTEKKYGYSFNKDDNNHIKSINKMIKDNHDKYFNQYEKTLKDYDMDIMFIKYF